MLVLDRIAERRILEAIEAGDLDRLPGAGRALALGDDSHLPEELRTAYRVLRNAGMVPEEVSLRRELRSLEATLESLADDAAAAARARQRLLWIRVRLEARGAPVLGCGYDEALLERMAR
jgi:hypothetical protein